MFTGFTLDEVPKKIVNQCDIIIDGSFIQEKIDNNRSLIGSTNQNINYITNRYVPVKNWFTNQQNLIEEVNISQSIFFNGDKI